MHKLVSALFIFIAFSSAASAVECPFGIVNDSYPGQCARYMDDDGSGLCDLSEPAESTTTASTVPGGQNVPTPPAASSSALSIFSQGRYDFVNLTAVMLVIYGISFVLTKCGRMTVRTHRMVWNLMLLLTFAVSAFLGILLVLRINYGILLPLPFNMLYWHVEAGIAMAIISAFHILWHLEYFRRILRSAPKVGSTAPKPIKQASGKRRRIRDKTGNSPGYRPYISKSFIHT
ncbi:MAG: hypothetical protein V1875_04135 [Candidatus Altiarchaeota archaeon]